MNEEKRQLVRSFQTTIKQLSDEERAALIEKHGGIVTIEGHALSVKNTLMVIYQRETSTVVGGFKQWLRAGRVVSKGQSGLTIFIPCKKKVEQNEPDETFFRMASVFDISQTVELEVEEN
jgi:hypothetical protein